TVKSQDVQDACRTIAALRSDATVVTMQNGVRSDREAADILGRARIVGCVLNISATYLEPGVVEQNTSGLFQVGAPFLESKARFGSAPPGAHLSSDVDTSHAAQLPDFRRSACGQLST